MTLQPRAQTAGIQSQLHTIYGSFRGEQKQVYAYVLSNGFAQTEKCGESVLNLRPRQQTDNDSFALFMVAFDMDKNTYMLMFCLIVLHKRNNVSKLVLNLGPRQHAYNHSLALFTGVCEVNKNKYMLMFCQMVLHKRRNSVNQYST